VPSVEPVPSATRPCLAPRTARTRDLHWPQPLACLLLKSVFKPDSRSIVAILEEISELGCPFPLKVGLLFTKLPNGQAAFARRVACPPAAKAHRAMLDAVQNLYVLPDGPAAGRFVKEVAPVTYALPLLSRAIALAESARLPPRLVA
jgi:hypothetical protein